MILIILRILLSKGKKMKNTLTNFICLRQILLMLVAISSVFSPVSVFANTQSTMSIQMQEQLASLEKSTGGRIGLFAMNTANNMHIQHNADERFPMCCTSKAIGVAAVLKKSMSNPSLLHQKITYTKKDLEFAQWVPITKNHLAEGMTVADLCSAAIMQSDNAAMNLLVKKLGGLGAMNNFFHSIGDNTSRVDRWWPDEASSIPGDLKDTSTPKMMAKNLQALVLGDILAPSQRQLLKTWMKKNTTGDTRIRAGVPKNWAVDDKTGTGDYGTTNDIGILWPPKCSPIIVAIYFTHNNKNAEPRSDVIAQVTRLVINEFAKSDKCIKFG